MITVYKYGTLKNKQFTTATPANFMQRPNFESSNDLHKYLYTIAETNHVLLVIQEEIFIAAQVHMPHSHSAQSSAQVHRPCSPSAQSSPYGWLVSPHTLDPPAAVGWRMSLIWSIGIGAC